MEPAHGDYGDRHTSRTISEHTMTQCWGNARWCDSCKEWRYSTGVVSLVLSSVCCPKCKRAWEPVTPTEDRR